MTTGPTSTPRDRRTDQRRIAELAAHDLADAIGPGSIVLQPLGAMEAHGPHLPLNADLLIAEHAVERVIAERGSALDLWALPPLAYTKSNEHAWAPGTVWLSATTMLAVLDDIARCVATTAARTLVFVNAHGGNSALLQVVLRDVRLKYGLRTFLAQPFRMTDGGDERGMGIHGGHDETSMVMALRPDLVDLSRAVRNVPEHLAEHRFVKWGGSVAFGWTSEDFEPPAAPGTLPIGVIGDPTRASVEHGLALWDDVVRDLGDALAEIAAFDPRKHHA